MTESLPRLFRTVWPQMPEIRFNKLIHQLTLLILTLVPALYLHIHMGPVSPWLWVILDIFALHVGRLTGFNSALCSFETWTIAHSNRRPVPIHEIYPNLSNQDHRRTCISINLALSLAVLAILSNSNPEAGLFWLGSVIQFFTTGLLWGRHLVQTGLEYLPRT